MSFTIYFRNKDDSEGDFLYPEFSDENNALKFAGDFIQRTENCSEVQVLEDRQELDSNFEVLHVIKVKDV